MGIDVLYKAKGMFYRAQDGAVGGDTSVGPC